MNLMDSMMCDVFEQASIFMVSSFLQNGQSDMWRPSRQPSCHPYGILKFNRAAMEFLRGGISSTLAASCINAVILDLQDFLKDDIDIDTLMVDKSKIDR